LFFNVIYGFTVKAIIYGNPWEIEAWDPRPETLIHGTRGEELEYDLEVTQWDGTNLRFIRRDSIASWTQAK
jgi:hypothetical protein